MKTLIAIAFIGAAGAGILRYTGALSGSSMVPLVFFAAGLVLVLLQLINVGDRRY